MRFGFARLMRTLVLGGWSRPAQASGSWWAAWPVPIMAAAVATVLGVPAIGPWGAAAMVGGGLVLGLVVARYVLSAVSVTASEGCRRLIRRCRVKEASNRPPAVRRAGAGAAARHRRDVVRAAVTVCGRSRAYQQQVDR